MEMSNRYFRLLLAGALLSSSNVALAKSNPRTVHIGATAETAAQGSVPNNGGRSIPQVKQINAKTKIYTWPRFAVRNGYGDEASIIDNFQITVIQDGDAGPTNVTGSYRIQNITQNDRGGGAWFYVSLTDGAGNAILPNVVVQSFPRGTCTPDPYQGIPLKVLDKNYFDLIQSATLVWRYHSDYEGKC
jgi:hypothetical protein